MSTVDFIEQAEEWFEPGRLRLIYRYGHDLCCADVFFSDGAAWRTWHVSNMLGDALQALMEALARLVPRDQEETQACWFHERAETRSRLAARWGSSPDHDSRAAVLLPHFAR